jgi:hypothetical protein
VLEPPKRRFAACGLDRLRAHVSWLRRRILVTAADSSSEGHAATAWTSAPIWGDLRVRKKQCIP